MSLSRADLVSFLRKTTDGDIDYSYILGGDEIPELVQKTLARVEMSLILNEIESEADISYIEEPIGDYACHAVSPTGQVVALFDSQATLSPYYSGRPIQALKHLLVFHHFDPITNECVFLVPEESRHVRVPYDSFLTYFAKVEIPVPKDHFQFASPESWLQLAEFTGFDAFTQSLREKHFQDRLLPGMNLIDIGAGPGLTWKGASTEELNLTLVDGHTGFLELAKGHLSHARFVQHSFVGDFPKEFVQSQKLSFSQDAAVCIAMPYVPMPEILYFVGEVLKQNGWFFFTALDPERSGGFDSWPQMFVPGNLCTPIERVFRPSLRLSGTLRFAYTPEELIRTARNFGFMLDGDLHSVQANIDPSFGTPEVYNCGFFRKH